MIGCKPLTDNEVVAIASKLQHPRDKCLFILGLRTGLRISELLSLRVADVTNGTSVYIKRRSTKGKTSGRSIPLHHDAIAAINAWISLGELDASSWLFPSHRTASKPIDRVQAYRILRLGTEQAAVPGKVATHSMRKTFAERMYTKLDKDLLKLQKALGHRDINSTIAYLSFNQQDIDDAILGD